MPVPFRALKRIRERDAGTVDWLNLVAYVVIAAVVVVGFWRLQTLTDRNQTALNALCSFRADLQGRVNDTRAFIADVKAGRRQEIPGISQNDLLHNLASEQSTLDSLKPLDCP